MVPTLVTPHLLHVISSPLPLVEARDSGGDDGGIGAPLCGAEALAALAELAAVPGLLPEEGDDYPQPEAVTAAAAEQHMAMYTAVKDVFAWLAGSGAAGAEGQQQQDYSRRGRCAGLADTACVREEVGGFSITFHSRFRPHALMWKVENGARVVRPHTCGGALLGAHGLLHSCPDA